MSGKKSGDMDKNSFCTPGAGIDTKSNERMEPIDILSTFGEIRYLHTGVDIDKAYSLKGDGAQLKGTLESINAASERHKIYVAKLVFEELHGDETAIKTAKQLVAGAYQRMLDEIEFSRNKYTASATEIEKQAIGNSAKSKLDLADKRRDLQDIIDSATRKLAMLDEEGK